MKDIEIIIHFYFKNKPFLSAGFENLKYSLDLCKYMAEIQGVLYFFERKLPVRLNKFARYRPGFTEAITKFPRLSRFSLFDTGNAYCGLFWSIPPLRLSGCSGGRNGFFSGAGESPLTYHGAKRTARPHSGPSEARGFRPDGGSSKWCTSGIPEPPPGGGARRREWRKSCGPRS